MVRRADNTGLDHPPLLTTVPTSPCGDLNFLDDLLREHTEGSVVSDGVPLGIPSLWDIWMAD
jgi:hypothetical protein